MITTQTETKRIVIQGVLGAFHEIAARHYYNTSPLDIVLAETFDNLVTTVENQQLSEGGLMAIENSIAGSILYNYKLLNDSDLKITGEVFLRIRHNLMALPGQRIEDIREVRSHPMAIAQCRKFFRQYPHIKLIEATDTALSAKKIQDEKLEGIAAIASARAADIYNMEILAQGVETNKKNYTRFLVLDRAEDIQIDPEATKVSVSFSLAHNVGSLASVLTVLANMGANLTKIQSVPIIGKEWQYIFFADFIIKDRDNREQAINTLKFNTNKLNILGQYKTGDYHDS